MRFTLTACALLMLTGTAFAQRDMAPPPPDDMDMDEDGGPPPPPPPGPQGGPHRCWMQDGPDGPHRVCRED